MNEKHTLQKRFNIVAILILLVGSFIAYFVYKSYSQPNQYLDVNEWGIKFKNDPAVYGYEVGYPGSIVITDKALSENSGLCGFGIYTYYRVLISDLESPEADKTKIEKLEFMKTLDGYNYYLEDQNVPDFCGEELVKSKEVFNTEIYE